MADQRIQYTEEMVGANHPTKSDTLNRSFLVEHENDGTHSNNILEAGEIVILPYEPGAGYMTTRKLLHCDGSTNLSRTTYADLFAVLSTNFGNDDANTFGIPDYRGRFLRGWADGSANDPDRASRTDRGDGTAGDNVGTYQGYEEGAHNHNLNFTFYTRGGGASVDTLVVPNLSESSAANYDPTAVNADNAGSGIGNETRPINAGVWIGIRY